MTPLGLAIAYLRRRAGQAAFNVLVGALGISAIATALLAFEALPRAAERAWGGVDLVVGPKGSPLDLVLCCALHVSDPQGLISTKAALESVHTPLVRAASAIALGDNIEGWRIVGAQPSILAIYRAKFAAGQAWTQKLQAVVGATVARSLHLKIGDHFVGAHGLASGGELHEHFPYDVVGILEPTGSVLDRLVLTDIETVRYIHEEQAKIEVAEKGSTDEETVNLPDAATAVVLSYRTPAAAAFLPRKIDASETFTAGSPTFEIARLVRYARPLVTAVEAVGFLLALVAGGGAAVAMVAAMNARARDLALLRALGARPYTLALVALAEAAILAVAALALGAVLSLAAVFAIRGWLADNTGLLLEPKIDAAQIGGLIAGVAAVALVATAVPAWRAARASIEDLLTS